MANQFTILFHGKTWREKPKDQYPKTCLCCKKRRWQQDPNPREGRPAQKAKCTLNQDNEFYYRVTPSESKTILKHPGKTGGKF